MATQQHAYRPRKDGYVSTCAKVFQQGAPTQTVQSSTARRRNAAGRLLHKYLCNANIARVEVLLSGFVIGMNSDKLHGRVAWRTTTLIGCRHSVLCKRCVQMYIEHRSLEIGPHSEF